MDTRPITKNDYNLLLELDKKVYPVDSPVTEDILDSWYMKNPEFGLIYEEEGKVAGVCTAIPLNKDGWTRLVKGELVESELDEKTIFDNNRDKELGIHIYHIERLGIERKGFYDCCLCDLGHIVDFLKEDNPDLKVIGFSGLCVTKEGIGLFEKKLKCRERKYKNPEHIIEKDRIIYVVDSSKESIDEKIKQGYRDRNRCKMLVTYPGEKSIVWIDF